MEQITDIKFKGELKFPISAYKHIKDYSVEWYTPPYVFEALNTHFDMDVASPGRDIVPWIPATTHLTENSLETEWQGFIWMNPPYGKYIMPPWLKKFKAHGCGIALTVDRTSTAWWQTLAGDSDLILQVNKKIPYITPQYKDGRHHNALGSSLIGYGEQAVEALRRAHTNGLGMIFKPLI